MLLITITGSCLLGCNGEQQECIKYGSMEKSSMEQALDMVHYCKNDKSVKNNAVVAIIDTKYDLSEIKDGDLWVNTKEIPNNGIDDDGEGTTSSIIKAIKYAEKNGADIKVPPFTIFININPSQLIFLHFFAFFYHKVFYYFIVSYFFIKFFLGFCTRLYCKP